MKQLRSSIHLLLLLVLTQAPAHAQEVSARLELLTDTVALGRPFGLRLEVSHPSDVMIFTPRGKKDFFPFELIDIEPEPTRTHKGVSTDVVTYRLSTFQLGSEQSLSLVIGYRSPDSKEIATLTVSSEAIRLMERIPEVSDLLEYRWHTAPPPLKDPPNLILLFLYLTAAVVLIGLTLLWLRGPVERYLRIRKVRLEWNRIARKIEQIQAMKTDQASRLDQLNRIWKTYLDPKNSLALLSMTTTELMHAIREMSEIHPKEQETLIRTSRVADEVIYAGYQVSPELMQALVRKVSDLLFGVYQRRTAKVSQRQSYMRQFLLRIRKLLQAPQSSKTMWKGY